MEFIYVNFTVHPGFFMMLLTRCDFSPNQFIAIFFFPLFLRSLIANFRSLNWQILLLSNHSIMESSLRVVFCVMYIYPNLVIRVEPDIRQCRIIKPNFSFCQISGQIIRPDFSFGRISGISGRIRQTFRHPARNTRSGPTLILIL